MSLSSGIPCCKKVSFTNCDGMAIKSASRYSVNSRSTTLGCTTSVAQAEPVIFLRQNLSLVKHVARTALQDRFCPQLAGPPQRIEGATAQSRKDIAIIIYMSCSMTVK